MAILWVHTMHTFWNELNWKKVTQSNFFFPQGQRTHCKIGKEKALLFWQICTGSMFQVMWRRKRKKKMKISTQSEILCELRFTSGMLRARYFLQEIKLFSLELTVMFELNFGFLFCSGQIPNVKSSAQDSQRLFFSSRSK